MSKFLDTDAPKGYQKILSTRPSVLEHHPPNIRPDNLRVQSIPLDYDKSSLKLLFKEFGEADVHSLYKQSTRLQCATITFPENPNSALQKFIETINKKKSKPKIYLDANFLGITPLFETDVKDKTTVVE